MDPRKTWVCIKGHEFTDFNRRYDPECECPHCFEEEAIEKMKKQEEPTHE